MVGLVHLPRMRPLSSRKSAILSVLDVGTSKALCLIARLDPVDPNGASRRPNARLPHSRASATSVRAA